jgi:hypothetical protein
MDSTWIYGSAKAQKRLPGVARALNQQLLGHTVTVTEWWPPDRRDVHTTFLVPGRPFRLDMNGDEPALILPIAPDTGTRVTLCAVYQRHLVLRAEVTIANGRSEICTPVQIPYHAPLMRRFTLQIVE